MTDIAAVPESGASCYACGNTDVRYMEGVRDVHAGTGRLYRLRVCRRCGSMELCDKLSDAELARIYPEDYYSYAEESGRLAFLKRMLRITYDRHRFVPKFSRLLEIGCGRGEYLARIKHLGSVVGLERSPAARAAGKALGVDVRIGDVEDSSLFDEGAFDCIYSNHAFEHLPDPQRALASMKRWLAPGGLLFIGIPNANGAVAHYFGANWFYLGPPLHVTNSTPQGMRALLERSGFAVQRIVHNSDPVSIPMSIHISRGGRVDDMPMLAKLSIGAATFAAAPLSKLLDTMKCGDCMEIHARHATGA